MKIDSHVVLYKAQHGGHIEHEKDENSLPPIASQALAQSFPLHLCL